MSTLVTGAAGFIGFHFAKRLSEKGEPVVGIDNLNSYYDVELKKSRLELLKPLSNFQFSKLDLADEKSMTSLFREHSFTKVVHLGAQAGVRYSLENPRAYIESNVTGFLNVLEGCRHFGCQHLIYASTSSVYGLNQKLPFSTQDPVHHPMSIYSASKMANEAFAHSYSDLFSLPTTGLRFFTVYGPWGRPDMALFKFTKKILEGDKIQVYNYGKHKRDFTFVDDIVDGMMKVYEADAPKASHPNWDPKSPDPSISSAPYRIFNIGNSRSVELETYIKVLEECLGKKANQEKLPAQSGDLAETWADVTDLKKEFDYQPQTPVEVGVSKFVDWYRSYYQV